MAFGSETWGSNAWGFGHASVSVTQDTLTMSMGDEATIADANTTAVTNFATASLGSVTLSLGASVSPTGIAATGSVGDETTQGDNNISVTGFTGTTSVGSEVVAAAARTGATGVFATGGVGSAFVWGEVSTSQSPSWTEIVN